MNTTLPECVGIRGVAAVLPPTRLTLEQLSARRMIVSSPADLSSFGFRAVHVADAEHDSDWLVALLALAAKRPPSGVEIHHVAAGTQAAPLSELVEFLVSMFRETHAGWRRGQIAGPLIADANTFTAFRRSVTLSRDPLLGQVMESMDSFLLAIVQLIAFVERATGQGILPRMVVMKHFRSVDAICETFGPRKELTQWGPAPAECGAFPDLVNGWERSERGP